jgi:hypothetical protein
VISHLPHEEFREKFELHQKSYNFKTHQELDEFFINIKKKCPTFYSDFTGDYSLLKSFDRGCLKNFFLNFFFKFILLRILDKTFSSSKL